MEKKLSVDVFIKNGNEKIEGYYYHNADVDSQVAIIFHGDKKNYEDNSALLNAIFNSFARMGFSTLMINFSRKTVRKEKVSRQDSNREAECEPEKETEEATVALNWVHEKNFESRDYWICSFGQGVLPTLQLVMRRPEINNYILIDPVLGRDDLNFIVPCLAYGMIMRSESNINFTEEYMLDMQERLITKTESRVETDTIFDNDKDINATILETQSVLDRYIKRKQDEFLESSKLKIRDKKRRRRKKKRLDDIDSRVEYINPIQPLDLDNI